ITPWFISAATFGKCSLISTPSAAVLIGLNSPAPLLSGLRSQVSLWLGPPSIQRRVHDLALPVPPAGAGLGRSRSHPDGGGGETPAAASFSTSRRDFSSSFSENMVRVPGGWVFWCLFVGQASSLSQLNGTGWKPVLHSAN